MATQSNKECFLGGFMKLFRQQWEVDLLIKAKDSVAPISAHKFALAARSEVFKKILESDKLKDSSVKQETITLSDMTHEEVKALVEFMYSIDGSISSESLRKHVRALYVAADKYEIPHLRDICRNYLISSLSSSNALKTLEIAQIPYDKALDAAAFVTIITNINVIAYSPEFKVFVVNHPYLTVEIMKFCLAQPKNR